MKGWNQRIAACMAVLMVFMAIVMAMPVNAFATQDGMVRVHLSSISPKDSHTIKINGVYKIEGYESYTLTKGKSYEFSVQDGKIAVTYGDTTTTLGKTATLVRCKSDSASNYLTTSSRNYPGDMLLRISDGKVDLVLTLFMEDYLDGVVGYEMSNSWPLEALKCQAVAARTFAYANLRPSASYDVEDTTASQVYKGTNASHDNVMDAVDATANQVLTYNSNLSDGYYCASNGGQTNTYANRWGGKNSYHTIKDDPYDWNNAASPCSVFAFTDKKVLLDGKDVTDEFASLLGVPSGAAITKFAYKSLNGLDSGAPENIREFNKLTLKVTYKASGKTTTKDLSVTTDKLKSTFKSGNNMMQYHRLWTYEEDTTTGGFRIVNSGYGHGVGMSQRGAQFMAKNGYTYKEILDFYYHGCELTTYDYKAPALPALKPAPTATPAPSATQKPEEDDDGASAGTAVAPEAAPGDVKVQRIGPNSLKLTWKKAEGAAATRIYVSTAEDGEYTLLQATEDTSYTHTGLICGTTYYYKLSGYNQVDDVVLEGTKGAAVSGKPLPLTPTLTVKAENGKAVLTVSEVSGANGYRIQRKVGDGEFETVLRAEKTSFTYKEKNGTVVTYRASAYQTVGESRIYGSHSEPVTVTIGAQSEVVKKQVTLKDASSTLNWRSGPGTSYGKVGTLKHKDVVIWIENSGSWSKVEKDGKTGYVLSSYLKDASGSADSGTTGGTASNAQKGKVKLTSGRLNVRIGAGSSHAIVGTLANGAQVEILGTSGSWYKIKTSSLIGYASRSYIVLVNDAASDAPSATQKPEATAAPDATQKPAETQKPETVVTAKVKLSSSSSYLNVRKGAGTGYGVVTTIKHGTSVTILETANGWSKIKVGETVGYVADKYLSRTSGSTSSNETPDDNTQDSAKTGTVKVNGSLNVRKKASSSSSIVGSLANGTKVTVLEKSGSWYKIKSGNIEGFVYGKYLKVN